MPTMAFKPTWSNSFCTASRLKLDCTEAEAAAAAALEVEESWWRCTPPFEGCSGASGRGVPPRMSAIVGAHAGAWSRSRFSAAAAARVSLMRLGVAVQIAFERKGLKPGFHVTLSRVETRRFQAMGQLSSTCSAPPRRQEHSRRHRLLHAARIRRSTDLTAAASAAHATASQQRTGAPLGR
jgi:hypothetical protein